MPSSPSSNPYHELTHCELSVACMRRASELDRKGVARTPQQRAELAEDTRHLLIAAGATLDPSGSATVYSPERYLKGGKISIEEAFAAFVERETKAIRAAALRRAGYYLQRKFGENMANEAIFAGAADSEESMRAFLGDLDAKR